MKSRRNAAMDRALTRAGLSLTDFAGTVGVDLSHVSHICAGRRTPSLRIAHTMARALGLSIEELFFGGRGGGRTRRRGA